MLGTRAQAHFPGEGPVSAWHFVNHVPISSWNLASPPHWVEGHPELLPDSQRTVGHCQRVTDKKWRSVVWGEKLGSSLSWWDPGSPRKQGVGGPRKNSLNPDCPSETPHCSPASGLSTQQPWSAVGTAGGAGFSGSGSRGWTLCGWPQMRNWGPRGDPPNSYCTAWLHAQVHHEQAIHPLWWE